MATTLVFIAAIAAVRLVGPPDGVIARDQIATLKADGYEGKKGDLLFWNVWPRDGASFVKRGGELFFAGAPNPDGSARKYLVTAQGLSNGDSFDLDIWLTVGGPAPVPPGPGPLPPGPPPGPAPVPPDANAGTYKLARVAFDEVYKLAINPPDRALQAASLAKELRALQSKLVAGAIKTKTELAAAVDSAMTDGLKSARPSWAPWIAATQAKLNAAKISTMQGAALAMGEVATGLEAVR